MMSVDRKAEAIRQTGKMRSVREETREFYCSYKAVCLLYQSLVVKYICIYIHIYIHICKPNFFLRRFIFILDDLCRSSICI